MLTNRLLKVDALQRVDRVLAQCGASAESGEFEDDADTHHARARTLHEAGGRREGPPGRENVVEKEDARARRHIIFVDLDRGVPVFERVVLSEGPSGELSFLPHGDDPVLRRVGGRRGKEEAARLDARHEVELPVERLSQCVDHRAQSGAVGEDRSEVLERDSGLWIVLHSGAQAVEEGVDGLMGRGIWGHRPTLPKVHVHIASIAVPAVGRGCFNVRMHHTVALAGHGVCLSPLAPLHAEQLFPLIDPELWSGMAAPRPESIEDLAGLFAARLEDPDAVPFVVSETSTGSAVGATGLYELSAEHGRAEIGGTFFGRSWWGSGANPASKLLLMGHAFEALGISRVAFRVDTRNGRSARALIRLGAVYEGTLRGYRRGHESGRIDTAVFSVLDHEWPAVRERLLGRLAEREEAPLDAA